MGNPLINLRSFFTDLFRVQIDGPELILRGRDRQLANTPPADAGIKTALHLATSSTEHTGPLSCDDIAIRGFDDWQRGLEASLEARRHSDGNRITQEMMWPTFWNWNSPVYVALDHTQDWAGNLDTASVSIAILGQETLIQSVLDTSNNTIAPKVLEDVFAINGRGYATLFSEQIADKEINLVNTRDCGAFILVDLEIR